MYLNYVLCQHHVTLVRWRCGRHRPRRTRPRTRTQARRRCLRRRTRSLVRRRPARLYDEQNSAFAICGHHDEAERQISVNRSLPGSCVITRSGMHTRVTGTGRQSPTTTPAGERVAWQQHALHHCVPRRKNTPHPPALHRRAAPRRTVPLAFAALILPSSSCGAPAPASGTPCTRGRGGPRCTSTP